MLGAAGAWLGLLLSLWAQDVIVDGDGASGSRSSRGRVSTWTVLGFSAGVSTLVSAVCGLIAARRTGAPSTGTPAARPRAARAAASGRRSSSAKWRWPSVIVVATAGLLVRTVANLRAVDVGFDTDRTLVVSTDLTTSRAARARQRGAVRRGRDSADRGPARRARRLPRPRACRSRAGRPRRRLPGHGDPARSSAASSPQVVQTAVTPGYFNAMGIAVHARPRASRKTIARTAPRRRGERDRGAPVLARRGSGRQALRDRQQRAVWQLPAAVGPARSNGARSSASSPTSDPPGFAASVQPEVYLQLQAVPVLRPVAHRPRRRAIRRRLTATIRSRNRGRQPARRHHARADARRRGGRRRSRIRRLRATLATMFSTLALMLGMLGVYGVMSYTVAQRTREIGIRMALGARRSQVARMIMGKALRLAATGVALGLIGAYVAARWISSLFFGVSPADAATLSAACVLLIVAAAAASLHPMRHAVRVEPAVALRNEYGSSGSGQDALRF